MEKVFNINTYYASYLFSKLFISSHLAECLREMTYLLVCAIKIKDCLLG